MTSKYLSILFISNGLVASNNRGENEGNLQTLQKVQTRDGMRTVLSGYAIKRAIRDSMQALGANFWRRTVTPDDTNVVGYVYGDNESMTMKGATPATPANFDDAMFGWMVALKDSTEDALKMPGAVECSVGLSTTPYDGDIGFAQGLKAKPRNDKGPRPSLAPFSFERHFTRYQFILTINLDGINLDAVEKLLISLKGLRVGGNHSSNAAELTPDVLVWRFHPTPGQGGLNLGASAILPPDVPVDLNQMEARAVNLGFTYQEAGIDRETTIADAITSIIAEIRG